MLAVPAVEVVIPAGQRSVVEVVSHHEDIGPVIRGIAGRGVSVVQIVSAVRAGGCDGVDQGKPDLGRCIVPDRERLKSTVKLCPIRPIPVHHPEVIPARQGFARGDKGSMIQSHRYRVASGDIGTAGRNRNFFSGKHNWRPSMDPPSHHR